MTVIYSKTRKEGLAGRYIDPALFTSVIDAATVIYTDDQGIKDAYSGTDAEVKPITKPKRKPKAKEKKE